MAQVIDILPGEKISKQMASRLLYYKITEPNFEETTLPAMLAFFLMMEGTYRKLKID